MTPQFDRPDGYSLNELAKAADMEPRTVRSWVQDGVVPGPLSMGPKAAYPPEAMGRLLAAKHLKETTRMTLSEIRRRLVTLSVEEINAIASGKKGYEGPGTAAEYLSLLEEPSHNFASSSEPDDFDDAPRRAFQRASGVKGKHSSFNSGEERVPSRARAEPWSKIEVTPDVFLEIRGPLDPRSKRRYERLVDLVRDWLTRGTIPD